jgi:hypothetical protein
MVVDKSLLAYFECFDRMNDAFVNKLRDPNMNPASRQPVTDVFMRIIGTLPEYMKERDGWFMNRHGGMCPAVFDTQKEIHADTFPVLAMSPQELFDGLQILRWAQGGPHCYGKLPDGRDVVWHGRAKWSTSDGVRVAARLMLGVAS